MTTDPTQRAYAQAVGTARTGNLHIDTRDPTISDIRSANVMNYPIGYIWQNTTNETYWFLNNYNTTNNVLTANWIEITTIPVGAETLTPDIGGEVPPAAGTIQVLGNTVMNGTDGKPLYTTNEGGNQFDINIQLTTTSTSVDKNVNNAGISSFDSTAFTVDSTTGFVTLIGGTGPAIQSLSDDIGTKAFPSMGNIQLVGHVNEQGPSKFSTILAGTNLLNINPMSPARWIVDPLGFNGTHTTIATAMASAASGDTILVLPGTYTENITFKAGVNVTALPSDFANANVKIIGKFSYTGPGTGSLANIFLQTNSDYILEVTGANASSFLFDTCYFNLTNSTGIHFTNSNASSAIQIQNSIVNITTTGIASHLMTSPGTLAYLYTGIANGGLSTTASSNSAGQVNFFWALCFAPLTCSATGALSVLWADIDCSVINTTALTFNGIPGVNNTNHCLQSLVGGGTASAISIGTTSTLSHDIITSSNLHAVTGAGTVAYAGLTIPSGDINTTTIVPLNFYAGTVI